jgi:hypothetical protein
VSGEKVPDSTLYNASNVLETGQYDPHIVAHHGVLGFYF